MKKTIYLGNGNRLFEYGDIKELRKEALKNGISIGHVTIGNGVIIENDVRIEDYCAIGNNVTFECSSYIKNGATIGNGATISNGVIILERATIKAGWKITNIVHLMHEYRYHVSGYLVDGIIVIQLGCFTRTLAEWENDFWNNSEFKKGTPEGKQRLLAFNKIKKIMKG